MGFVATRGRQKPGNSPSFLVEKRVLVGTRRTQEPGLLWLCIVMNI